VVLVLTPAREVDRTDLHGKLAMAMVVQDPHGEVRLGNQRGESQGAKGAGEARYRGQEQAHLLTILERQ
jgi:hypothetical protein